MTAATRSKAAKKAWATRRATEENKTCPECKKHDKVLEGRSAKDYFCERCQHLFPNRVATFPEVKTIENNPFTWAEDWTFRWFGDQIVGKGVMENGTAYVLLRESTWKPSGIHTNDFIDRQHRLQADGLMFEAVSPWRDFFPIGVAVMKTDPTNVQKEWKRIEQERIRVVIGQVFPEVLGEFTIVADSGVVQIFELGTFLSCNDLDTISDYAGNGALARYLGMDIEHDVHGRKGKLVMTKDGSNFLVKWHRECMNGDWDEEKEEDIPCPNNNKITFYTMSGCHHGAWCYLANPEDGEYEGDLRNVSVYCDDCGS